MRETGERDNMSMSREKAAELLQLSKAFRTYVGGTALEHEAVLEHALDENDLSCLGDGESMVTEMQARLLELETSLELGRALMKKTALTATMG